MSISPNVGGDPQAVAALQAPAWHSSYNPLKGYTAGILRLAEDRLTFLTKKGVAFDVPVGEVRDLSFSWGDSVMKCEAGGKKWRFYFSRPQGAPAVSGDLVGGALGAVAAVGDTVAAVQGVKGIFDSRKIGKEFKQALGA
jgi:hypothetical protein